MTSAIETILWPGIKEIVGADAVNAGVTVLKTGYHGPRDWMKIHHPTDYSIQLDIDKLGPGNEGAAIDVTFKSAQAGDFRNIARFSKLLYQAGVSKDSRAYPLREFQGNIDLDRDVEGWSYYRGHALTSPDLSHLWHIHQSIHRKYINDAAAMRSILSIWAGTPVPPPPPLYPTPVTNDVYLSKFVVGQRDSDSVWQLQKALGLPLTGDFDKATAEAYARAALKGVNVVIHNDL